MKNNMIFKALTIAFALGFLAMVTQTIDQEKENKILQVKIDSLTEEISTIQENIDIRDEEIEVLRELVDSDFDAYADYERLETLRKEK